MTLLVIGVVVVVGVLLIAGLAAVVVFAVRAARSASGPAVGGGVLRSVPAAARSFDVDLGGARGLVSVAHFVSSTLTAAGGAYGLGPPGTVHVKALLGPAWPPVTVLPRAPGGGTGGSGPGAGVTVVPTGDPAFDARFLVLTTSPDPRPVLAVVNAEVRAILLCGDLIRWQMGELSWLEVAYRSREQEAACVDWAVGLVTTAVVTSGIRV